MFYNDVNEILKGIDKNYFLESDRFQKENNNQTELLKLKPSKNEGVNSEQPIQIIAPQKKDNNLRQSINNLVFQIEKNEPLNFIRENNSINDYKSTNLKNMKNEFNTLGKRSLLNMNNFSLPFVPIINNEEKSKRNEVDKTFLSKKTFINFQDNNNSIEKKSNSKLNISDFSNLPNIKEKKSKTINMQLLKEDTPYQISGNINNICSIPTINILKTDYNKNPHTSANKKIF